MWPIDDLCRPACENPSASEMSCAEPITTNGSAIAQNHIVARPNPQPAERRRPCRRRRKKARTPGTNIVEKTYQLLETVLICSATSAIMMSMLTASTTREKIASSRRSLGLGGTLCTPTLFRVRVDTRNLREIVRLLRGQSSVLVKKSWINRNGHHSVASVKRCCPQGSVTPHRLLNGP